MPTSFPPLVIPPRRALVQPMRRPFNVDKNCVLCLLPEINSKWLDYSSYGNDGTIEEAIKIYNGRWGEGLSFDGTNDYVNCENDTSLNITDAITICAWIKPDTLDVWAGIVAKGSSGFSGYRTLINPGTNQVLFQVHRVAGAKTVTTAGAIPLGKWSYIVATYDKDAGADNLIVYRNTVPTSLTTTGAMTVSGDSLIIGEQGDLYFDGVIDEVHVYNRMLAAWEIKALYEQGKPG